MILKKINVFVNFVRMAFWIFIVLLLPFLCYYIFTKLFDLFFGKQESDKNTFITHVHHYHDNRQVHLHNSASSRPIKDQGHLNQ